MAFWTEANSDPIREYRFTIQTNGPSKLNGVWWWAQSVERPTYEVDSKGYQLGNHYFNYPGILKWNPIKVTIVDIEDKTENLINNLQKMGYETPDGRTSGAIQKKSDKAINDVIINQFNGKGEIVQTWNLKDAMVTSVDFGELSYKSDDLLSITLTIVYDYATYD